MSKEPKNTTPLSKEMVKEVRGVVEEKIAEIKKFVDTMKDKKYNVADNKNIITIGLAFTVGLAFGIALSKKK